LNGSSGEIAHEKPHIRESELTEIVMGFCFIVAKAFATKDEQKK
jgi:hypothetical protein